LQLRHALLRLLTAVSLFISSPGRFVGSPGRFISLLLKLFHPVFQPGDELFVFQQG